MGKTKVGRVVIGDRVFIGWGSTVLPNVKIGKDVIVAAGSIVNKDIPEGVIVAGVPAKIIGKTSDYIEKNKLLMNEVPVFSKPWDQKTENEMKEMYEKLENNIGFDE